MNPTSEDQSGGVATAPKPAAENSGLQPASGTPVAIDKGGMWPAPGAAKATGEASSWDAAKQARANQMEEAKNNKSGGILSRIFGGAKKASPVSVETVTQPDPWAPAAGAEVAAASQTLTSAQMDEAMKAGNALVEPAPGPAREFEATSAQPPTSEIQAAAAASSVPEQTTPPVAEASAGETPVAEIPAAEPAAVVDAVAETETPQPTAAVTEQTASVSEPASAGAIEQPVVAASTAPDAPAAGLGMDVTGNQVTNADLAAASTGPGMPNPLDVPKPPEATAQSGSPSLPPIPGLASPDMASPSVVKDGQSSQTTWNNEGVKPPVEAVATGNSEPAGVATTAPLEASTAALEEAKKEEVPATAASEVVNEMNDPDKVASDPMAPLAIEKLPGQPLDMSVTSDATTEPASASSVTLNSAQMDEAMKAGNALVEPAPGPAKEFEGTSAQPTTTASHVTTADAFGIPQEQPAAAPLTPTAAPEQALSQTAMNDINQAAAGVDSLPLGGTPAPVVENPTVDAANQVVEASVASNPLPAPASESGALGTSVSPEPVPAGVGATPTGNPNGQV